MADEIRFTEDPVDRVSRRDDRLLEIARRGGDGAVSALADIVKGGADSQVRGWLREELALARTGADEKDSARAIGRLASAGEEFLRQGIPALTALLCGLAVNYRQVLAARGQGVVDPADDASLHNITGLLAFHLGRLDTANDFFLAAQRLAQQAQDAGWEAASLLNQCNLARSRGNYDAASDLARSAQELYVRAGDERGAMQIRLTLANMALETGDPDAATDWLGSPDDVTRLRQSDLTASYHHVRGKLYAAAGQWVDAERELHTALRAARRARHSNHEVATLQSLAALASDYGDKALARRRTRAAVRTARDRHLTSRLMDLLPAYVGAELRAGNSPAAADAARELVDLCEGSGENLAEAHCMLAATLIDQDALAEAHALLALARSELVDDDAAAADGVADTIFHNTVVAHWRTGTTGPNADDLATFAAAVQDRAEAFEQLGLAVADERQWGQAERLLLRSLDERPASEQAWAGLVAASRVDPFGGAGVRTALLRRALTVASDLGQDTVARQACNDLAIARVDDQDLSEGLDLLVANLTAAEAADDRVMAQVTVSNLAETRRRMDDLEGAESDARRSLDLSLNLEDFAAVASSWQQLGLVLGQQNRIGEARPCYERALELADPSDSTYASALSGLAGIAMTDDPQSAIKLYTRALDLDTRTGIQQMENLIYLCDALAAVGDHRRYNRRLQQIADLASSVPFQLHFAFGLAESATKWAQLRRFAKSGRVLALGILIWAPQERSEDGFEYEPVGPLLTPVYAAGAELVRQQDAGDPFRRTRRGLQAELLRVLESADAVVGVMDLVDSSIAAIRDPDGLDQLDDLDDGGDVGGSRPGKPRPF